MKICFKIFFFLGILLFIYNCKKEDDKYVKHLLVIQPNGSEGEDALLNSYSSNTNYGTHPDFIALASTVAGTPFLDRSLIKFDFSSVPNNVIIDKVTLTLYGYNSPANGSHRTLDGSNEAILKRITESWDESTVTWNNQPSATDQDAVTIPMSTSENQSYTLDITKSAKYMIENPSYNFGYKIQLVTEEYYRQLIFASSDNVNNALHPVVKIFYRNN